MDIFKNTDEAGKMESKFQGIKEQLTVSVR